MCGSFKVSIIYILGMLTMFLVIAMYQYSHSSQNELVIDGKPVQVCVRIFNDDGKGSSWYVNQVYQPESSLFVGRVVYDNGILLGVEPTMNKDTLSKQCSQFKGPNGLYSIVSKNHILELITSKSTDWIEIVPQ